MPVDIHPEEGISGVELILTRLHAGGKFSNKNYQFSGGLHGVGISVVNALATRLDVTIKRSGKIYQAAFEHGNIVTPLTVIGKTNIQDTGTCIHFWPDTSYFDTPKFSVSQLAANKTIIEKTKNRIDSINYLPCTNEDARIITTKIFRNNCFLKRDLVFFIENLDVQPISH